MRCLVRSGAAVTAPVSVPAAGSRALAHPAPEEIRLEGVLHALSDPLRLGIVRELAVGSDELACSDFDVPVSKSTTTHHFRVLREAGVIRQVYRGTAKMNGLRRDDLDALFPGLLDSLLEAAARQEERLAGA
ncbi:ArsR/SmtB family transcription factor [Streptomyces sp. NPDC004690]|uniref:ArsR/SmtB family transcription factor n=1 Tax=Streptomyces sp. 2-6 TaxID=2978333 RepID=UPI0013ABCFD4|nr:helix-turn-helix transcriptional regulator [Streptomyces sp. SID8499]MBY8864766.1 ArsR family transcriptional regulator [Streptomyces sennicomposti]MYS44861.1 helix-turn-helix domain-containing protein [Streptomyces sp. SID5998]MYX44923.1 helix-turn-helix domain-containing protein [Streptomyces sp. SID89]NED73408.1 helix-turn-helix transcriptional regulator [Streptomyces sp. SID9944]NED34295.1 helix-turn-helix transcriptional regulator [Streptomyces sp. SID8499]